MVLASQASQLANGRCMVIGQGELEGAERTGSAATEGHYGHYDESGSQRQQ